jgi:hypothetical protein
MSFEVLKNEVGGRPAAEKSPDDVRQRVLDWLQNEGGFAQVVTINKAGFPVGRTMGAPVNDDWTVDLVQRNVHKRLGQLRRNPKVEIIWVGTPAPGSVNDRPHVYDFGLLVPRAVFLRGIAEFRDNEWLKERFARQTAINLSRGQDKAPVRDAENVVRELIGLRVTPLQVRAEGFGDGAESFTWTFGAEE